MSLHLVPETELVPGLRVRVREASSVRAGWIGVVASITPGVTWPVLVEFGQPAEHEDPELGQSTAESFRPEELEAIGADGYVGPRCRCGHAETWHEQQGCTSPECQCYRFEVGS